jgi:hypothetical protein
MYYLISPIETTKEIFYRVCQKEEVPFDVAEPLFWFQTDTDYDINTVVYNIETSMIEFQKLVLEDPTLNKTAIGEPNPFDSPVIESTPTLTI